MQLALDAGNSSIKFGLFQENNLEKVGKFHKGTSILEVLGNDLIEKVELIVSCSVLNQLDILDLPKVNHIRINHRSKFPFKISYETPESLGIDRVVACAGAYKNQGDILVIDAGSCITYDYLSNENGYEGGAISPGLNMRFQSMNNFTEKLPLVSKFENNPKVLGTSTISCLKSGTINGITNEIKGFISHFKSKSSNLNVFLTGGDAIFLGAELKSGIFADQNLVLKGLNSLIPLNEV